MTSFVDYWPQWPANTQGTVLVEKELQGTIAELIALLWNPHSSFIAEANAQRNFSDFHCTDWVVSETELPDLPGGYDWTYERTKPFTSLDNIHQRMRKVRFANQKGNFLTPTGFKTEEVQRCICHEDKKIIVDACIASTAPLCENIRVLCRYILVAETDRLTRLTVSYHIVYLQTVNFMVKGVLEKGVREGLASNYKTYLGVLRRHISSSAMDVSPRYPSPGAGKELDNWPFLDLQPEPYCSVVNWSAFPPGTLINALLDVHSSKTATHGMLAFVAQIALLLGYGVLLYGLFTLWTYIQQHCSSALPLLDVIPPLTFIESIRLVLMFLGLMEMTHLCVFYFKRFFGSPRLACVHLHRAIAGGLQRFPTVKLHPGSDPQENLPDPSDPHGSAVNAAEEHNGEEESDDESDGWTKKLANAFWILFQYNSPDFPRFDQAPPIEERTNADGSIVEEIFENQRLQPIRGWGHTWPGHFLPTDRFSHWSAFDSDGNIVTSDKLEYIRPALPEGWEWVEDDWTVDTSKAEINAVDAQGWYYSLDFPWIRFTPEKNSGIRKLSDFVRRRRLIRTRRKIQKSDSSHLPSVTSHDDAVSANATPYFSFFNFL